MNGKYSTLFITLIILYSSWGYSKIKPDDLKLYSNFGSKVRSEATFIVPFPGTTPTEIKYFLEIDQRKGEVITSEYEMLENKGKIIFYWDRFFLKDSSYVEINGEKLPATCLVIKGQDNRQTKKSGNDPLVPDHIIDIKIVVGEYTCTGPINPNFPISGKKEMWDTYLHYRITDPTVMLPTDAGIRYRWNEFETVLVK